VLHQPGISGRTPLLCCQPSLVGTGSRWLVQAVAGYSGRQTPSGPTRTQTPLDDGDGEGDGEGDGDDPGEDGRGDGELPDVDEVGEADGDGG
jgi:hypothetical protein